MNNLEIAKIFKEISIILDIQEIAIKPQAYIKAASYIESMQEDIAHIYHEKWEKWLENLPWIWKNIALKIIELIKTDQLKFINKLRMQIPIDVKWLISIEWIWPKTIKKLYKSFWIKTVNDLYKIAKMWKIKTLGWFKEKSEENIIKNIEFLKSKKTKYSYKEWIKIANELIKYIKKYKWLNKIEICWSIRRGKKSIKDIDILASWSDQEKLINHFCSYEKIISIIWKWLTKTSVKLNNWVNIDLRIIPEKSWWSAMQYFTWSKEHNINLRKIAINKWFKLNEYWLFKWNKQIWWKTENEIYNLLWFDIIPPNERINKWEFEKYIS